MKERDSGLVAAFKSELAAFKNRFISGTNQEGYQKAGGKSNKRPRRSIKKKVLSVVS